MACLSSVKVLMDYPKGQSANFNDDGSPQSLDGQGSAIKVLRQAKLSFVSAIKVLKSMLL